MASSKVDAMKLFLLSLLWTTWAGFWYPGASPGTKNPPRVSMPQHKTRRLMRDMAYRAKVHRPIPEWLIFQLFARCEPFQLASCGWTRHPDSSEKGAKSTRIRVVLVDLPTHLGVSKNRGTPKSSILIGFSIINHPFWGTPDFGNTHLVVGTTHVWK